MTNNVRIDSAALTFIESLLEKSQRIVKDKLKTLQENPYPGKDGDKERLNLPEYELYRIHIARSYTAFYTIDEKNSVVTILDIMTIEKAHKKYGRL